MSPASAWMALLCLLGGSIAAAQECLGYTPFQKLPVHFFVRGSFSDPSTLYGGGVGVGGSAAFGELDVEGVSVGALGASSFTVGGEGGLQIPVSPAGTVHLCPIAAVSYALGPNNVNDAGIHYREADYTFGAAVGITATHASSLVKLIPTASYLHTSAHNRFTDDHGVLLSSNSRSLDIVEFGVGVLFGRDVSITPTFSHIAAPGSSWNAVGVRFAMELGGTRTAFVNNRSTSCAGLTAADSTVYDTTQVTERPAIHTAPEIFYPPIDREFFIQGRVILGVVVGSDGAPEDSTVTVLSRVDPAIDRAAVRWIAGVTYWPACRAGHPVRARIAQPLDYCVVPGCRQGKS